MGLLGPKFWGSYHISEFIHGLNLKSYMREDMMEVWGRLIQASKSQVGPIEAPKVSSGRGLGRVLLRPNRGPEKRCDLP